MENLDCAVQFSYQRDKRMCAQLSLDGLHGTLYELSRLSVLIAFGRRPMTCGTEGMSILLPDYAVITLGGST